jgi:hypothetical protein
VAAPWLQGGSDVITRTAIKRINWSAYKINQATDKVARRQAHERRGGSHASAAVATQWQGRRQREGCASARHKAERGGSLTLPCHCCCAGGGVCVARLH